jgi:hypothetical protein
MSLAKSLTQGLATITCAAALTCTFAYADLIPNLSSGPTADGLNFDYNYTIGLSTAEELNPVATNGISCPGFGTSFVLCSPTGTFVTIYDIQGFVSASTGATDWAVTTQPLGRTPSTISAAFDDPGIMNVTFFYTGPIVTTSGGVPTVFSSFQIVSSVDGVGTGHFTDQATQAGGNGETDQGVGAVSVPNGPVSTTPETATLTLSGLGLVLLGWGSKLFHRA